MFLINQLILNQYEERCLKLPEVCLFVNDRLEYIQVISQTELELGKLKQAIVLFMLELD